MPSDLRGVSRICHFIIGGCSESAIRFSGVVLSVASELLTDIKYSLTLVPEGLKGNQKKRKMINI